METLLSAVVKPFEAGEMSLLQEHLVFAETVGGQGAGEACCFAVAVTAEGMQQEALPFQAGVQGQDFAG